MCFSTLIEEKLPQCCLQPLKFGFCDSVTSMSSQKIRSDLTDVGLRSFRVSWAHEVTYRVRSLTLN